MFLCRVYGRWQFYRTPKGFNVPALPSLVMQVMNLLEFIPYEPCTFPSQSQLF